MTGAASEPKTAATVAPLPVHGTESTRLQIVAAGFCFLFGLCLIANTQLAADGNWYWYAQAMFRGVHLYKDLKLALQPFFVLETKLFLSLLGNGWLAGKLPAVIHLAAMVVGMLAVSLRFRGSDLHKSLLLVSCFFITIHFEMYRFDDYHVVGDVICIWSVWLLLEERLGSLTVLILGTLCGIAFSNRITDGAALLLAVTICLFFAATDRRWLKLPILLFAAVAAWVLVVTFTGDRFSDYLASSIFHAAGAKGGADRVLLRPVLMPFEAIRFLLETPQLISLGCSVAIWFSWSQWLQPFLQRRGSGPIRACLGTLLLLAAVVSQLARFIYGWQIMEASVFVSCFCYIAGIAVFFRRMIASYRSEAQDPLLNRQLLILIPLGQLAAGSMSTGGHHFGLFPPIGLVVLLAIPLFPNLFTYPDRRLVFVTVAALLGLSGFIYRIVNPSSWHSYSVPPLFTNRQIYQHPVYGPMVIDNKLQKNFRALCSTIRSSGAQPSVLSLPLPYMNYYCSLPPWRDYIQTFYDLSDRTVIDHLMVDLQQTPPTWILYQRQLTNLRLHEEVFNGGNRLPHRDLDDLIMARLRSGEWRVETPAAVEQEPKSKDSLWILIRTH